MKIRLYTTLGCHLCEEALLMLLQLQERGILLRVEEIEIADSDLMINRFGIRVPVIVREDDTELDWPFSIYEVEKFLSAQSTA